MMKSLWFLLLGLCLATGCGVESAPPTLPVAGPAHAPTPRLEIVGRHIYFEGKELHFMAPVDQWIAILGKDYVNNGYSYTWHTLGLSVDVEWQSKNVTSIGALLNKHYLDNDDTPLERWPKHYFRGELILDSISVFDHWSIASLNAHKKGGKLKESHRHERGVHYDYEIECTRVGVNLNAQNEMVGLGLTPNRDKKSSSACKKHLRALRDHAKTFTRGRDKAPAHSAHPRVDIVRDGDNYRVYYEGKELRFMAPLREWVGILGKEYVKGGAYVWNKLGIGVLTDVIDTFVPELEKPVVAIEIFLNEYLSTLDNKLDLPEVTHYFRGELIFDGASVFEHWGLEAFNAHKRGTPLTKNGTQLSYGYSSHCSIVRANIDHYENIAILVITANDQAPHCPGARKKP